LARATSANDPTFSKIFDPIVRIVSAQEIAGAPAGLLEGMKSCSQEQTNNSIRINDHRVTWGGEVDPLPASHERKSRRESSSIGCDGACSAGRFGAGCSRLPLEPSVPSCIGLFGSVLLLARIISRVDVVDASRPGELNLHDCPIGP
jgi:hypothetical protein